MTETRAICPACKRPMEEGGGCGQPDLFIGKKKYARSRESFGEGNCHDCGAAYGHVHHWGCDEERCPKCGLQLISCDCKNVTIEVRESKVKA